MNEDRVAAVWARQDVRDRAAEENRRQDASRFSVPMPRLPELTKVERRQLRQADILMQGTRGERLRGAALARQVEAARRARVEMREIAAGHEESQGAERQKPGGGVAAYNKVGAVRMKSRDGLANLLEAKKITPHEWLVGYSFRALLEEQTAGLRSQLGEVGTGGSRGSTDGQIIAGLTRAWGTKALADATNAIVEASRGDPARRGARELKALLWVAGEGRCIDSFAKGGAMHAVWLAALLRALEAARGHIPLIYIVEGD